MSNFDISRIPDHVFHDAVNETLGDQKLERIREGYNFRCPICGDSKKNKHKKRGYVIHDDVMWTYVCHNECGSMSFLKFLKSYHRDTYRKIIFHGFSKNQEKELDRSEEKKKEKEEKYEPTLYQFKEGELLSINATHPLAIKGLQYCISRQIPEKVYSKWFVCIEDDKFRDKDKQGKFIYDEKGVPRGNEYRNRLIIPYYKLGGKWSQFDARSLEENPFLRYKNMKDVDREMYNIAFMDTNKFFFMLEGSIDSTFLQNSGGFGGTKYLLKYLEDHPQLLENTKNGIFIWDNDEAGYDAMLSTIELGFKWFNWSKVKGADEIDAEGNRVLKDLNNLVLRGDVLETDEDGFIKIESLMPYVEKAEGGTVKINMLYGNRKKKRKEKYKQLFNKNRKKENSISFNWGR